MKRLAVLALLAGCLQVPESPGQECTSSSDCDSGESCSEGMCYGAPPDGLYAAAISAPTSTESVGRELASISLPQDGDLGDLQLDAAVTISGRVEMFCDLDVMYDEELGYFEPRPWHEDRPQRPKVWPADTWRAQWGFGSFGTFPGYP